MQNLLQDLRYGIRLLLRRPGFTLVSLLALTIGIGANTAIFSLVNAILLRQLPFKNPDQLVSISTVDKVVDKSPVSMPDFVDFRDQNRVFEEMAATVGFGANLTGAGEPERFQAARVSANLFQMMGVNAVVGRALQSSDDNPGNQFVVVLSHGLWKRRFGGAPGIVGKPLTLNDRSYTIIGVLPPDFIFPGTTADIGIPLAIDTQPDRNERGTHLLRVFARLKPGITLPQAEADLNAIAEKLQQQYPDTNARKIGAKIITLQDDIVGDFRRALLMLLGAVGLVLLIACVNIANLLLARATTRHKEMAVRMAMGATRARLIRQLITESLVLALVGGLLGLLLTYYGLSLLIALSPTSLPRVDQVEIDVRVLGFTMGLSMLAGVLFGLMPALQASSANVTEELKSGSRGVNEGSHRNRVRSLLVISEVALSLMLLICAGLFVKSFLRLQDVDPGFNPERLVGVRLSLPKARYSKATEIAAFNDQLLQRIQRLPGVESAAAISVYPMGTARASADFIIEGRPPASAGEIPAAQHRIVSPGYFQTMKIPILKGREFTDLDTFRTAGVVIINETLARKYWPNENPVGRHLRVDDADPAFRDVEIVGVVGDVKQFGLESEPEPELYVPYQQLPNLMVSWAANNMSWMARAASNPLTLADDLRREVQSMDTDVPVANIGSMEQVVANSVAPRRFNTFLLQTFASIALLLVLMGIYAVMSYSVTQRTAEIGIRMALGAQSGDVLKLIVGQGLKIILIGVAVGLTGAFALTRMISSMLYEVSTTDIPTFAGISLMFTVVALLASYIPARRATKVDPVIALRSE